MPEQVVPKSASKNYKDEWKRTNPDIVVYKPTSEFAPDSWNLHFLVTKSPAGTWLAFWTQSANEGEINQSMVISRSTDRGAVWSKPVMIDGKVASSNYQAHDHGGVFRAVAVTDEGAKRHAGIASYGFPVVAAKFNRVYCFYLKCLGIADFRYDVGGTLRGRWSDDDGVTWSDEYVDLPIKKTPGDNPDPKIPMNWIFWQIPTVTSKGEVIAPFTCWSSAESSLTGSCAYFLRFDNILTEPNPYKLTTTILPEAMRGLRVPGVTDPGCSWCEEPAVVEMSNGCLFCVVRNCAGYISFSVSEDSGRTWTTPAPLYQQNDIDLVLNPVVPCPIWKLKDGRYVLLYCNNIGDANGGYFPCFYDCHKSNRYPSFISVGREDLNNPRCPIRFGPPKMFVDNQGVGLAVGARTDASSYGSLLEDGDDRILFYPDREHFLFGKRLTDEWLADCDPGESEKR